MTTDQTQPDDPLAAELAEVLKSSASAPPLRAEFVHALSQRLDADFAASHAAPLNGHAVRSAPVSAVAKSRSGGRAWRRWSIFTSSAAVLFAAVVMWGPAYGWTAAIRHWVASIVPLAESSPAATIDAPSIPQVANHTASHGVVSTDGDTSLESPPAPSIRGRLLDVPRTHEVQALASAQANRVVAEESVTVVPDEVTAAKPAKSTYEATAPVRPKKVEPPWEPSAEPLPLTELSQRVDDSLAQMWESQGIHVVAPASDVEFMRRVYLDLTGRIPSVSEVHEFLDNKSPQRREQLVDRLLNHRDHATHLAAVWRAMLLPDGVDVSRLGGTAKFDEWLADRFAVNKPYDQIVRDLLQAEGRVSESGPLLFYSSLRLNPEELAGKTTRAFLGVRMECAQCHNHPFDESISQQDFWSFAAFFARISRPKGKMDVTSPVLQVRDSQQGDVMIPQTDKVVAPRLPLSDVMIDDVAEGPSRRQQLVDWLTSKHNGQFARATVNRVWAHLFGRGLVEPVDDMRPANPPISPETLDVLSRDFAASGFDLRRLIRGLVMTKAYQLSSQSAESDPSRALHFAQMNIKSFTAEQLYDCITIATKQGSATTPNVAMVDGVVVGIDRFQDANRQAFIEQFRAPAGQMTDYHAGIPQALTLMHGGLIHTSTDLASSGLLKSLSAPFFKDSERLDTMFLSTLSRYPEPAEREMMLKQLVAVKTGAERQQVLGDVLWALLNSGEFTFNH